MTRFKTRAQRALPIAVAAVLLAACATGSEVTQGGGATIAAAQAAPVAGKYRVIVGAIIDKTDPLNEKSIPRQLGRINAQRAEHERMTAATITGGLQDMLITDLFASDRFIVLERASLDDVMSEQEFAASPRVGEPTRLPKGLLEGAELIVLGAVTAFDAGTEGAAIPLPLPLNRHGDFGLLKLRFSRGYIAMNLRVIDARTGRVLSAVTVEGKNSHFGMDFGAFFHGSHGSISLPRALTYFQNTPVEAALQKMVTAAVAHISERVPVH